MKKKNEKDEIISKGYLTQEITSFKAEMRAEIQEAIDKQSEELKSIWTKTMDELYQRIDPLLEEIVTAREDRTIATRDTEEMKATLKDHEKRLQKLEKN